MEQWFDQLLGPGDRNNGTMVLSTFLGGPEQWNNGFINFFRGDRNNGTMVLSTFGAGGPEQWNNGLTNFFRGTGTMEQWFYQLF
jgi:hypothetical protein